MICSYGVIDKLFNKGVELKDVMCGIAGVFSNKKTNIGNIITDMLESLQHRGEDSAGIAIYGGLELNKNEYLLEIEIEKREELEKIKSILGKEPKKKINSEPPIYFTTIKGELEKIREIIKEISYLEGVRVLSSGKIYMMKDTGSVNHLSRLFDSRKKRGSHAIGHTRFSTESKVDRYHSHPFQSLVKLDTTVVHNGQITNYWEIRDKLENKGHQFETNNDTECIVHYIADKLKEGRELKEALQESVKMMDGPFSYIIAVPEGIGVAKDSLGLRPAVIGQSKEFSAIASEEMALREALGEDAEITYLSPGEVKTFTR